MPDGTIILSDLHLTEKFDKSKFELLKKVILNSERVIINGDFFDGYLTTFDKFMNSSWRHLFPLLKSKQTIYIHGNHDHRRYTDERVNEFSSYYGHEYIFSYNNKTYIVRHGHEIKSFHDGNLPRYILSFMTLLNHLILELVVRNKGVYGYKWVFWDKNKLFKEWAKNNLREGEVFISSHTHYPEIDLDSKVMNTGYGMHGYLTYLRLFSGKVDLVIKEY